MTSEDRLPSAGRTGSGSDSPQTRDRWWLLGAVVLLGAHFASFDITRQPIVSDVRYFLYFAARTASGAVPHLDLFDNKTQLATFVGATLHRVAGLLHTDPLLTIRAGYLTFAALAGLLLFVVHRRLAAGDAARAFPALLPYCGFALLGALPSVGNLPKMLTVVFATVACLLVYRGRWILAGACTTLAFLDWQIGALALVALLVAIVTERRQRLQRIGKVAFGSLLSLAPFLLYYSAHGALVPAFRQVVVATLAKGSVALENPAPERLYRLISITRKGCDGQEWLLALGLIGLFLYPLWLRRRLSPEQRRLGIALAVYHYGIVLYSLLDFQMYGDLFILLHSLAFFSAVTAIEASDRILALIHRRGGSTARARLVILVLLTAAVRPSLARPVFVLPLPPGNATHGATLADQRQVARDLEPLIAGRKLAFVDASELLFLTGRTNSLPFIYWNPASYAYYRASPDETSQETWERLVREVDPDAIVESRRARLGEELRHRFSSVRLRSANGAYSVRVFLLHQGVRPAGQEPTLADGVASKSAGSIPSTMLEQRHE